MPNYSANIYIYTHEVIELYKLAPLDIQTLNIFVNYLNFYFDSLLLVLQNIYIKELNYLNGFTIPLNSR